MRQFGSSPAALINLSMIGILASGHLIAQTQRVSPGVEQQQRAEREYSDMLARDGTFALRNPPAGGLTIWISPAGPDFMDLSSRPITIAAGEAKSLGDLAIIKKLLLISPRDQASVDTGKPVFEWAPFPDTARYEVYVVNDASRERLFLAATNGTQLAAPEPLPSGQRLRWGVSAFNSSGEKIAEYWWNFKVAPQRSEK